MKEIRKKVAFSAIPVTVLALTGIAMRKMSGKDHGLSEHVREITMNACKEIETSCQELQEKIESRSAQYLEKNIDNIFDNMKSRLDHISSKIKSRLGEYEMKNPSKAE